MNRRLALSRMCAAVLCTATTGIFVSRMVPSHAQSSTAPIAGIAFSKNFEGPVVIRAGSSAYYTRVLDKTVQMASLPLTLTFNVVPNTHCDELYKALNGKVTCTWNTTLRTDQGGFGTHSGTFRWDDGVGDIIEGTMQGTIGAGTHRLPGVRDGDSTTENCEECRTALHFEGTMSGTVASGPLKTQYHSLTINASYAGRLNSTAGITAIKTANASVDGISFVPSTIVK